MEEEYAYDYSEVLSQGLGKEASRRDEARMACRMVFWSEAVNMDYILLRARG